MNTFGRKYRISIFGESHGKGVGITIDGCPPGIDIDTEDFNKDLNRRKSGRKGTTQRIESDKPKILSGIYQNKSSGSPITLIFKNEDTRSQDYKNLKNTPRPGHSDFTAKKKYMGFNDPRGGGHFSGRLTLGIVAAGVIAKKILLENNSNFMIEAKIIELAGNKNLDLALENAIKNGDSIGGIIECRVKNLPIGLGEPFFDSIESMISHLVFSIPAIKGIEFGSGFSATKMTGEQHNDKIINKNGKTESNNSGGISGGISNGNELIFRVAVKPTSSISKKQETYNFENDKIDTLIIIGRHDVCIALRIPVIIEAACAIAIADFELLTR